MTYPADYGFIEETMGRRRRPARRARARRRSHVPGLPIRSRIVGVFHMADEKGRPDEKIICVPLKDLAWVRISDVHDTPAELRNEIEHFFQVCKDLEAAKVETLGYGIAPTPSGCSPKPAPGQLNSGVRPRA